MARKGRHVRRDMRFFIWMETVWVAGKLENQSWKQVRRAGLKHYGVLVSTAIGLMRRSENDPVAWKLRLAAPRPLSVTVSA